jgi:hypothetical protein
MVYDFLSHSATLAEDYKIHRLDEQKHCKREMGPAYGYRGHLFFYRKV